MILFSGMYLTDLTYINTIHPCTGGLDVERSNKVSLAFIITSLLSERWEKTLFIYVFNPI